MPSEQTFQIVGLRELQARASRLEAKLERRVYSKAVRSASKPVLASVVRKAPARSGAVKRSLVARANNKAPKMLFGVKITVKGGVKSSGRTARRGGKGNSYSPDETVRYYRFIERGTKHHAARAFLEPGLDSSASQFLSTLKRELALELEKQAR